MFYDEIPKYIIEAYASFPSKSRKGIMQLAKFLLYEKKDYLEEEYRNRLMQAHVSQKEIDELEAVLKWKPILNEVLAIYHSSHSEIDNDGELLYLFSKNFASKDISEIEIER